MPVVSGMNWLMARTRTKLKWKIFVPGNFHEHFQADIIRPKSRWKSILSFDSPRLQAEADKNRQLQDTVNKLQAALTGKEKEASDLRACCEHLKRELDGLKPNSAKMSRDNEELQRRSVVVQGPFCSWMCLLECANFALLCADWLRRVAEDRMQRRN